MCAASQAGNWRGLLKSLIHQRAWNTSEQDVAIFFCKISEHTCGDNSHPETDTPFCSAMSSGLTGIGGRGHAASGYHINTKIAMTSKEDIGLVQGQVGAHGHTAAGATGARKFGGGCRRLL